MKTIFTFLFAFVILIGCSDRNDDPAPVPTQQISAEFIGTWKVEKKMNISGYIPNTDTSLFVTVSPDNIKYKTINGGNFDGFGTVSKSDNADEITLSNGTRLIMFKTVQPDGYHNFVFNHSNSMKDDYLVKKQ